MSQYPVREPSKLERVLFDAHLVREVSLAEIYDIKGRTSAQQEWQDPAKCGARPDVHCPDDWNNGLYGCTRWEFFAHVLRDCKRVLDVGCGDGWPSLYLARSIPEVVGIDISPQQTDLARNTAKLAGLSRVRFEVGDISNLASGDASFDGVCFGGNVLTYGYEAQRILREIWRVLRPGGAFVLEQYPVDRDSLPAERIQWFIDGGPPIFHYGAGVGLYSRSYFIFVAPDSPQGKRLADCASRVSGYLSDQQRYLSDEQRQVCFEIKQDIENGHTDIVEKAIYSGESRSLAVDELPALLRDIGFSDFASWALPDGGRFAGSLDRAGLLRHLRQEDLLPCIRALVESSQTCGEWVHQHVTCRKP